MKPSNSGSLTHELNSLADCPDQQTLPFCPAEDGIHSEVLDLLTATPEELTRELSQRVMKHLDERLKGASDADPVRLGAQGYRARLYEQKFGATPGILQVA